MKHYTDEEIFLIAIKTAGLQPEVNHTDNQFSFYKGIIIGMIIARDELSGDKAMEKGRALRGTFYQKWVKGELKMG